jgi:molybdopterin-guanine dinucleotide biosynthesis protein B
VAGALVTPCLGIAGYSGSGKTTLIEGLLPRLATRGLRVGVLKHDAHQLSLDHAGKDTARCYAAGAAAVAAHDPTQAFLRVPCAGERSLAEMLVQMPRDLDLILVEGHKDAPIPRLVCEHPEPRPPIEGPGVLASLPLQADRVDRALALLLEWLEGAWRRRPVGVHCHPDPDLGVAAVLARLRQDPDRAWVVTAGTTDPGEAWVHWLVGHRAPGTWAVLPVQPERQVPSVSGGLYEPCLLPVLERAVLAGEQSLLGIVNTVRVATPPVPPSLHRGGSPAPGRSS